MSYGDGMAIAYSSAIGTTRFNNEDSIRFCFKKETGIVISSNDFSNLNTLTTDVKSSYEPRLFTYVASDYKNVQEFKPLNTLVHPVEFARNLKIDVLSTVVQNEQSTSLILHVPTLEPITTYVESDRPPAGLTGGSGGGNGNSGLKNFRIVTQKDNYFECTLNIVNANVTEILGLPNGLEFSKGTFRGSPTISGKFFITLNLSDGSYIDGTIIVAQVPRKI